MFQIGSTLREARERRGLSFEECAGETRIRARYLRAMEAERFDLLPAPAYVPGFLRAYADVVGADAGRVLEEYRSRQREREEERAPSGPPEAPPMSDEAPEGASRRRAPGSRAARSSVIALVALAAAGGLGLLGWHLGASGPERAPSPTGHPTAVPRPVPAHRPTPRGRPVALALRGTEGSWALIRRDGPRGPVLFDGVVRAGTTRRFRAPRLWVRAGWAPALAARVDGRPVILPAGTATIVVTPTGARVAAHGPPPIASRAEARAMADHAYALMQAGHWREALPLARRVLPTFAGSGDPYAAYTNYDVGRILLALGRCGSAVPYLEHAARLERAPDLSAALERARACA